MLCRWWHRAMKKRLSSLATPYYKFTPPALLALGLFWLIYDFRNANFVGALVYLILFGFLTTLCFRLKKVHLSSDALYISDYFRLIAIPLEQIVNMEASSWWAYHPRTITMDLSQPSKFGPQIVFIPRGLHFLASEIVDEIRALIAARHNKSLDASGGSVFRK